MHDFDRKPLRWSPYLRWACDYRVPLSRRIYAEKRIGDHAAHYFIAGTGNYAIDGVTYSIEPGAVFSVRPGHGYRFELEAGVDVRMLNLHFDLIEEPASNCPFPCPDDAFLGGIELPSVFPAKQNILNRVAYERLFLELDKAWRGKGFVAQLKQKALLFEALSFLYANAMRERSVEIPNINAKALAIVTRLVEDAPARRHSLDELAKLAGVSKSLLCRVFMATVGKSPQSYITARRMELAADDLLKGGCSIKEIAVRYGFSDIQHFSRVFKRTCGVPPGRFRNSV
jgi:AraC-like DNA-binding protein